MDKDRNLREEIEELRVFSIEGSGLLTEKAVFSALDAIRESNGRRDEAAEWEHIKELQKKKNQRIQGNIND
jgi:hypothetical protein